MADLTNIERVLNKAEPELRAAFLDMIAVMGSAVSLTELASLLAANRFEEALARMLQAAPKLGTAATQQMINAGNDVARQIGRSLGEIIIDFDQTNDFAVRAMRENQLRLVQGFSAQQREATRQALLDGITRGENPRELARTFRNSIGLTRRQVQAVNNFRRALEEGSADALSRTLRDRRFDPSIQRALDSGTPLSQRQIDKMVARYRERMLNHRATTIARTEALRSVHEGQDLMFQQAINDGQLDPNGLTKEWNTARDERVRSSHADMHNQVVQVNEQFTSGKGNTTSHPGGFGVASEDINCRCTVGYRMTSLPAITGGVQVEVLDA